MRSHILVIWHAGCACVTPLIASARSGSPDRLFTTLQHVGTPCKGCTRLVFTCPAGICMQETYGSVDSATHVAKISNIRTM